jgi:ribonuclease-3
MDRFSRLIKALGHTFKDPNLLEIALTHRSKSSKNYERMEFLGDSILGFVIAKWLFSQFDELSEGKLSRMRSSLVRREALARVARTINLGNSLILGEGELKSGGFDRDSILADAVESVIGAIYLDGGFTAAEQFIHTHFDVLMSQTTELKSAKDPKSRLQELMQKMGYRLPSYSIVDTQGQHHDQLFTIECRLDELPYVTRATAKSRREAEQIAAKEILDTHFKV